MILRKATPFDIWWLRELRNDPATLAASRNTQEVTHLDHQNWYQTTTDLIYIAEENGERVGTIRFIRHPHEYELSITVAPEYRGKGYASQMLVLAVHGYGFALPLVAYVRLHNERSHGAFERAGWTNDGYYTRYEAPLPPVRDGNPPSHQQ